MKVTPSSPFETRRGLWVSPVRGVTTECRTSRVNWLARLRSAGFFNDDFNIGSQQLISEAAHRNIVNMIAQLRR